MAPPSFIGGGGEAITVKGMDLDSYQEGALRTALYPRAALEVDPGQGVAFTPYPALGLAGECGEVCGAWAEGELTSEDLRKELGDVLWYTAVCAHEAGYRLSEVGGRQGAVCFSDLTWEEEEGQKVLLRLCGEVGKVAERAKKALRDSGGVLLHPHREMVAEALGEVLVCLGALSAHAGSTLEEVAGMNLAKLASRAERNVLGGSGDNR